jgi:hypothetical protein
MLVIAGQQTIRTNTKHRRPLLSLVCFNFGRGTPTKAKGKYHFPRQNIFEIIKMVTLLKQERSNGDVTSKLLSRKNGRASSPTIFSKNFAAGYVLLILLTDTVYFTLPMINSSC